MTDPAPSPAAARPAPADPQDKADKPDSGIGGFLKLALAAWVLRCLIVAPFSIPSGSMLPTMLIGDHLVVAKWPYGYSKVSFLFGFPPFDGRVFARLPERGDIVVFRHPANSDDLVKRVVGLPGDTVEVRGGQLVINGVAVPKVAAGTVAIPVTPNSPCKVADDMPPATIGTDAEGRPACLYRRFVETLPGGVRHYTIDQGDTPRADEVMAVTVPQDHVFMMGDNRDDSGDSRYSIAAGGLGPVPVDKLIGRAQFIYWSTDGSASWVNPLSWFSALRADRLFDSYRIDG